MANFNIKTTTKYNNKLHVISDKIDNMKDVYNSDEGTTYEYIKNKSLFLDLLTMGDFWEEDQMNPHVFQLHLNQVGLQI